MQILFESNVMHHWSNHQGRRLFSFTLIAKSLDKINKPSIYNEPTPLKSCLKTTNLAQENCMCSLVLVLNNHFPVKYLPTRLPLYCLNICTSESLQMIWFLWRDFLLSQNLISNPYTCQDLMCPMNCCIKLQCPCHLRQHQYLMICVLG